MSDSENPEKRKKLIAKPRYFVASDLIKPLDATLSELTEIHLDGTFLHKPYLVRGVFAYSLALFESTIRHYLRVYYLAFPEKISAQINKVKVDYNAYMQTTFSYEVFEKIIDELVKEIRFGDLIDKIDLSFNQQNKVEYNKKELADLKEIRNILVHNNLKVDKNFNYNTGTQNNIGSTVVITAEMIDTTLTVIRDILNQIKGYASEHFNQYDEEKLIKDVWGYFFPQVLSFELVSHEKNGIRDFFPTEMLFKRIPSLSGSERVLLSWFMHNYSESLGKLVYNSGQLNMQVGTFRMRELVELFDRYPLLLQRN